MAAASVTSGGNDWSPASRMSSAKEDHCHVVRMMIESRGYWLIQFKRPRPSSSVIQPRMPKVGSNRPVFQNSAAATGMMKNGVVASVRATLRPANSL
jgi:hypothetical protein